MLENGFIVNWNRCYIWLFSWICAG